MFNIIVNSPFGHGLHVVNHGGDYFVEAESKGGNEAYFNSREDAEEALNIVRAKQEPDSTITLVIDEFEVS